MSLTSKEVEALNRREEAKDLVKVFKYEGKLASQMWEKIHE